MARFDRQATRRVLVSGSQGYGGKPAETYSEEAVEVRMVTGSGREMGEEMEANVMRPMAMASPDVAWKVSDRLTVGTREYEVEDVALVEGNGWIDHVMLKLRRVGT